VLCGGETQMSDYNRVASIADERLPPAKCFYGLGNLDDGRLTPSPRVPLLRPRPTNRPPFNLELDRRGRWEGRAGSDGVELIILRWLIMFHRHSRLINQIK
jgi:hypothetical protein